MHATCPDHHILLDVIILILDLFEEGQKLLNPSLLKFLQTLVNLPLSGPNILPSAKHSIVAECKLILKQSRQNLKYFHLYGFKKKNE
jgi:hypothetical protein